MVGLRTAGKRSATVTVVGKVQMAKLEKQTIDALFRKNVGLHARVRLALTQQQASGIRNLGTVAR